MRLFWLLAYVCVTSALGQETEPAKNDRAAAGDAVKSSAATPEFLDAYREKALTKWEKAIKGLETRDQEETDPADAILFVGSSSIRRWSTIKTDMAPYRVIQRGYGGAKYSDLAVFAERILHPHAYRAVAIFVGNDVSGKPEDHTPKQVEELVRYIVDISRKHQPDAPVLLIEVTPTEKRFQVWAKIREVNARLREIALSTPQTYFVPTAEHYLDPLGNPRNELFVDDKLHLNADGYTLWSSLIRRRLDEVFQAMAQFHDTTAEVDGE